MCLDRTSWYGQKSCHSVSTVFNPWECSVLLCMHAGHPYRSRDTLRTGMRSARAAYGGGRMTPYATGIILAVLLFVCTGSAIGADTPTITVKQTVVRVGPDRQQAILATVPHGTTFALLETRQGW